MVSLKGTVAGGLPILKNMLQRWTDWVEGYCSDRQNQDAPYWYNEQANTSTLVNVIAEMGGRALMEMTEQGRPNSNRKVDLWFMLPNSQRQFLLEAKRSPWWWCKHVEDWLEMAEESLDVACRQIKGYKFKGKYTKLAAMFLVPMVRKGYDVGEYVATLIAQFEKWQGSDATAWYFNEDVKRFSLREGKYTNTYPGVMLLICKAE